MWQYYNIPVQLSNNTSTYLDTDDITIINEEEELEDPSQMIPSYNIRITVVVFSFFGIMISNLRRKYYKWYELKLFLTFFYNFYSDFSLFWMYLIKFTNSSGVHLSFKSNKFSDQVSVHCSH